MRSFWQFVTGAPAEKKSEEKKKTTEEKKKMADEPKKKEGGSVMMSVKEKATKKKAAAEKTSDSQKEKGSKKKADKTSESQKSQVSKKVKAAETNPEKCKLVKGFVEATLSLGVKGLTSEFRGRKRVLKTENMTEFVAQQPNGRNRYKDVGCLDATRVKLTLGPVEYIHANYVSTPSNPKKFICTQAPQPKTCPEFWYMVVQEKSAVILMLCNLYERGAPKCAPYFPQEKGATLTFADGDISVVAKKQGTFPFKKINTKVKIIVTEMEVTIKDKEPHICTHYHWLDWPDRGVPEADMAPIQLLNSLKDEGKPIVVHCSAGIGRTGSMVLLQHVLELLADKKPVEPMVGYMDELRKQRHNSVQTEHQYLYMHMVLLLYMKKFQYLDNSEESNKLFDVFSKDYQKATAAFN